MLWSILSWDAPVMILTEDVLILLILIEGSKLLSPWSTGLLVILIKEYIGRSIVKVKV